MLRHRDIDGTKLIYVLTLNVVNKIDALTYIPKSYLDYHPVQFHAQINHVISGTKSTTNSWE